MTTEENVQLSGSPSPGAAGQLPVGTADRSYHDHAPFQNVNEVLEQGMTPGQRIADTVASTMGSWRFIIIQSTLLVIWVVVNVAALVHHWDPYPFILLNLGLSMQAAYAAPIIMMSQNRQAIKDRIAAEQDFHVNAKAEDEVEAILRHLEYQDGLILQLLNTLEEKLTASAGSPD